MPVSIRSSSHESLRDEIARLVQSQTGGRIHSLNVEVIDRDVIITGRATTYYLKQLATHAALELVDRFDNLTNDIAVC